MHGWKETLGHYSLAEITPLLLAEKRDKLLAEKTKRKKLRTPATVNRYLTALSHVFTIAIKKDRKESFTQRSLNLQNRVAVCASYRMKNVYVY
ncbi:hypothetical protein [Rickettsiella massiliensis]|uniref:hypothetical protein n=1 Tax=Rickettsiella massiliensis TaxID=676517 RepID=UPI00192C3722|nr:hypothetical protein [Rickettsiella massiliensis]